jgi:hypothetical protein
MAYDTNNPLGSKDPRDLYDNATNFDNFSNGPEPMYPNRFGVLKLSIEGMNQQFTSSEQGREVAFQEFLAASAFVFIGDYGAGLNFTSRSQYMIRDGLAYRIAPATTLPYTTTGNWVTEASNFTPISGDDVLRQDLADPAEGSNIVAYETGVTVKAKIDELSTSQADAISGKGPVYYASKNGIDVNSAATDQAPAVNALLASMPSGSVLVLDGPSLRTETPILIPKEGLTIRGLNRRGSTIRSYGTGSIIESLTQNTETIKFTNFFDLLLLRDASATGSAFLLNLKSMQFTTCERLWVVGANVAGQIGVLMEARGTAAQVLDGTNTECSYNVLRDMVIGGVTDCVSIRNVANSNLLENLRCQASVSGGYGIRVVVSDGTYVNNTRILNCATEYPGQVTSGIYVGANVSGTVILGHRYESMNEGLRIIAGAGAVYAPDSASYFSSNTNDVIDGGSATHRGTGARARFTGGATPAVTRGVNVASVARTGAGTYLVTFSKNLGTAYVPLVSSSNPMCAWVSPTGTTLEVRTYNSSGVLTDATYVSLSVEL